MHNHYAHLYNHAVFGLLREFHGNGQAVVFARSGSVGAQKFPVHWGGDCDATFESMAETLRGGLGFGLSGGAFWSHDISGFNDTASPALYKRWVAFGLLSSHSRLRYRQRDRVLARREPPRSLRGAAHTGPAPAARGERPCARGGTLPSAPVRCASAPLAQSRP